MCESVGRTAARQVEHRSCRERVLFSGKPANHGGRLTKFQHAPARDLERLCQCGFCGAKCRRLGVALLTGDRTQIDNVSVVSGDHGDDRPAAVKLPEEANIDHIPESVRRIFPRRRVRADDSGVVDQHIDLSEPLPRGRSGTLDCGKVGNIRFEPLNTVRLIEFCYGFLQEVPVTVPNANLPPDARIR